MIFLLRRFRSRVIGRANGIAGNFQVVDAVDKKIVKLDNAKFRYDPYPIGVIAPVFEEDLYKQMLQEWPALDIFKHYPKWGNKYSLAPLGRPKEFAEYISKSALWTKVHAELMGEQFIQRVIDVLKKNNIDLGISDKWVPADRSGLKLGHRIRGAIRGFTLKNDERIKLSSQLEFSMMPSDGGALRPHTDDPKKIITLVFSMVQQGEWDKAWGGGTAVLKPNDMTQNFNHLNRMTNFDESEQVGIFEFEPNQCVIFVKTFNSLHSVPLMKSGRPDVFRKSLTLNISAN